MRNRPHIDRTLQVLSEMGCAGHNGPAIGLMLHARDETSEDHRFTLIGISHWSH